MKLLVSFLLHTLFFCFLHAKKIDFYDGIRNEKVQAVTYLTGVVEKYVVKLEVSNSGDKSTDVYMIAIPKSKSPNFSFLKVTDIDRKTTLSTEQVSINFDKKTVQKMNSDPDLYDFTAVKLASLLEPGQKLNLKLTFGFMHVLSPLPAQIKKTGKQFVVFEAGSQKFTSPYLTVSDSCGFSLPSDKIRSYTKPAKVDGKTIRYGPFEQTKPLSLVPVRLHFQFHVPFLTVTRAVRDFELSHWGNIRIEEEYFVKHDGAKLKGAYEPNSYMRALGRSDPAAVHELRAMLPNTAYGVYYRDRIGNISTSKFRTGEKKSVLEIRPRYPLYGGWATDFTIGYDVPSQSLISYNPKTREHLLNISFGIPFREPVTDRLVLKVALPEGASDVQVRSPYPVEQIQARRFTYLDTLSIGGGRPLLIFKKSNICHLHNGNLIISYKYDEYRVYSKVFLVCGGIFVFFVSIILFFRIDLSLDDKSVRPVKNSTSVNDETPMGESEDIAAEDVVAGLSPKDNVDIVLRKLKSARFNTGDDDLVAEIERCIDQLTSARTKKKKYGRKAVEECVTRLQKML